MEFESKGGQQFTTVTYQPDRDHKHIPQLLALTQEGLAVNPDAPVTAEREEHIIAPNLTAALQDPNSVIALVKDPLTDEVVGYSWAIPINYMTPEREAEMFDTAYIYFTVIKESQRGKGLVGHVTDQLLKEIATKGYTYVERDSRIENGYADNIDKNYKDSILERYDHTKFPEFGPERHFRIDIQKYLASKKS